METETKELSASEALYGFCGWLTSRVERTVMSASDDAGVVSKLIEEYCSRNDLKEPCGGWATRLRVPEE